MKQHSSTSPYTPYLRYIPFILVPLLLLPLLRSFILLLALGAGLILLFSLTNSPLQTPQHHHHQNITPSKLRLPPQMSSPITKLTGSPSRPSSNNSSIGNIDLSSLPKMELPESLNFITGVGSSKQQQQQQRSGKHKPSFGHRNG